MPARTGYQVLLMFQCVFHMLVCTGPCTGHVIFFRDKSCLPIGALINTRRFEIPDRGAYMPTPGDPNRETVSDFQGLSPYRGLCRTDNTNREFVQNVYRMICL